MSVGSTLAEARVRAGLSVAQVSDSTMIRKTLVENIEADDYHACGGEFYARGHIKSIAHAIGLDPAPLLAEFDAEHAPPEVPTASGVLDLSSTSAAGFSATDRRRPNWTVAMALALAVVVAFGGFQLISGGGGGPATTDASQAGAQATSGSDDSSSSSTPSDSAPSSSEPSGAPSDAIAAVPVGGGVTVVLDAVDGRSWVSATGKESGVLFQNVLDTGREQTFRDDRQVKLVVGNAGAVHLVVNGRDLGSPGGQGEVVRLTFGPGDPSLAGG